MPKTVRSQLLEQLLPSIRGGIRAARLPPSHAEDVEQQVLMALASHVQRLIAMSDRERAGYAFITASRAAIAVRNRVYREGERHATDDVLAWDVGAAARSVTPEQLVSAQERAARADRVMASLDTKDRAVVDLMAEPGLSERAAAQELGISRGSLAFRLRRARELLGKVVRGTLSR